MTEKQGGSDVHANTTRAVARPDGTDALTGHTWFTWAPMSDLFLVLAQLDDGLSCFLVPRVLPDGSRNVFRVQWLEDKLGDPDGLPLRARRIAGLLVLCQQGSLLLRHAPAAVADAFCASRLGGDWAAVLGTLPTGVATREIIERTSVTAV